MLKFFLIDYEQRDLATVYMRRERVTVAATKDKQRHCRLSVQPTYRLLLKTSSASAVCTNTEVVQCTTGVHVDVRSIPNKLCWLFAKITQIYTVNYRPIRNSDRNVCMSNTYVNLFPEFSIPGATHRWKYWVDKS